MLYLAVVSLTYMSSVACFSPGDALPGCRVSDLSCHPLLVLLQVMLYLAVVSLTYMSSVACFTPGDALPGCRVSDLHVVCCLFYSR